MLYSTCTLDVSENEEMVRYVTEKYPFEAESIDPFYRNVSQPTDKSRIFAAVFGRVGHRRIFYGKTEKEEIDDGKQRKQGFKVPAA